jgi:hypothetical protein
MQWASPHVTDEDVKAQRVEVTHSRSHSQGRREWKVVETAHQSHVLDLYHPTPSITTCKCVQDGLGSLFLGSGEGGIRGSGACNKALISPCSGSSALCPGANHRG